MGIEMTLSFWQWWILALGLLALEAFVPGAIFLWLGIAAGLVGALAYIWPAWHWEWQLALFAVFSIATLVGWRTWQRHHALVPRSGLNQRGQNYVGRSFTLSEPIVNGLGKIRVDDSTWKVRGHDCPAGSRVEVTGVDGVILLVANETKNPR